MRPLIRRFTPLVFALATCIPFACASAEPRAGASAPLAAGASAPRPHILFIFADDLGWQDVGYHGSDIRTPNIDQLARGGARLEQCYAQPMCTPTRAALLTGRYPFRYGLQTLVIPSTGKYSLATDEYLLPEALKAAGYETAIVGKWHLGHAQTAFWPTARGFDHRLGMNIGEIDYFTHESHGVVDWYRENAPLKEPGYSTTLLGTEAARVIASHDASKPLFMYLAFNAPHSPFQAPQEYLDRYKQIEDPTRRAYAAMVSAMDDEIGRVLGALKQRGMLENTLIVFQSDNGAMANAMFAGEVDVSKLKIPCSNGPYRDGKGTTYEGGTRVVALANWPGHIAAGSVVDGPLHVVDWYPTLVGLAGGSHEKAKPLDGMNVWDTIASGRASPRTEVVYNIESFGGAVRQGDWKLVWKCTLPTKVELFDIAHDPYEKTNVADAHPDIVQRLQKRIDQLGAESVPSLLLQEVMGVAKPALFGAPPTFPTDEDGE